MSSTIWSGDKIKALLPALGLGDAATIRSGTIDPTSTPVAGIRGDIYIRIGASATIYQKIASDGTDTNWIITLTSTSIGSILDGITLDQNGSGSTIEVAPGGITNTQINAAAAIDYSKLNLTGDITDSDISATASIALNKLNPLSSHNRVLVSDNTGVISESGITNTTLGFLDATSSIQTQLNATEKTANKGAINGYASLDGAGHIPFSQLPGGIVEFQGTWDASTNTPTLANGIGTSGQFYITSTGGTVDFGAGPITFNSGDWVLYNGSIWERAVQSNVVQSVNGNTGIVTVDAINQLTSDVTTSAASGSQSESATVAAIQGNTVLGTTGTGNVVFSGSPTISGTLTGASANFSGAISASNLSGTNTGDQTITLTGEATGSGTGSFATTLTNSAVIGKVITGYSSSPGVLSPTDSILVAIEKLDGNTTAVSGSAITALTGDVTATGPGSSAATLATVNVNTGSFGSSTSIPNFTVNGKGLITAAGGNVVIAPAGTLSGTTLNSSIVSSSLTSVGTISSGTWNGSTIDIAHGGTGQTSKAPAFDALQPMTTGGDIIYGGASGTGTRLANGSAGQVLTSAGTTLAPTWATSTGFTYQSTGSAYGGTNSTLSFTGADNTVVGQGAGAAITGIGSNNTLYGFNAGSAITTGQNNVVLGDSITTGATIGNSVVIGSAANSSSSGSDIIIGAAATSVATTSGQIVIGQGASAITGGVSNGTVIGTTSTTAGGTVIGAASTGAGQSIILGKGNSVATGGSGIIVGNNVTMGVRGNTFSCAFSGGSVDNTSANNQIVFGAATGAMKEMWLGEGAVPVSGTPSNVSIQATGVVTTSNQAGGSFTLSAGNGTGTGGSGSIIFRTAPAGSTGATANTLANVGVIDKTGAFTLGATSTAPTHLINGTLGLNGSSSGTVTVATQAAAGTYNFNLPTTAGSAGQFLTSQAGGSTAMTWSSPPAVGNFAVTSQTTTYAILTTDNVVLCSGSAFTVTLPTAVGVTGKEYLIKKTDSSLTNIITIATTSSQTIDGVTTKTLNTDQEQFSIVSDGANWQILDHRWSEAITDTGAFTIGATTTPPTLGTIVKNKLYWSRTSATMATITWQFQQTVAGTAGSGDYKYPVPSGITIDTTLLPAETGAASSAGLFLGLPFNYAAMLLYTGTTLYCNPILYDSSNFRIESYVSSTGSGSIVGAATSGSIGGATSTLSMTVTVPVSGWSA